DMDFLAILVFEVFPKKHTPIGSPCHVQGSGPAGDSMADSKFGLAGRERNDRTRHGANQTSARCNRQPMKSIAHQAKRKFALRSQRAPGRTPIVPHTLPVEAAVARDTTQNVVSARSVQRSSLPSQDAKPRDLRDPAQGLLSIGLRRSVSLHGAQLSVLR